MGKGTKRFGGTRVHVVNEAVARLEAALGACDSTSIEDEARALVDTLRALELPLDQLEHAGKLIDLGLQMMAVGHELRQPLLTLKGFAQLLRERPDDAEFVRATAATLVEQSELMEALLDRIQAHLRGEFRGMPARCDVNAAVEAAATTLAFRLRELGLTLERDLTENLPEAAAPPVVVQQILVNLVGNACDALRKEGGTIRVRTWNEGGVVALVEDDGPGISGGRDLFLPFVSDKAHGTGLGLWLSRALAERAGGSLEVVPEAPGAAFRLTLPEASPANRPGFW